ncbi:MAG: hypothetical protein VB108_07040 [Anaerolineaceae bacterium]|nr:hypothetical protein [Anaerolineaceae bacterium]
MDESARYSAKIFLNAVIPLWKEIVQRSDLEQKFAGKNGIIQISTMTDEGKWATHFILEEGRITTKLGEAESKPDLELAFKNVDDFNGFFKGTSKKLPKINGLFKLGLLVPTMQGLLKMASTLGAKTAPAKKEDRELLTRMMLYLLSAGISTLNKQGHPMVSAWAKKSPDRVYAWAVNGYEDLGAYIRVKAGNSKAARGIYTRSKPFFTMRFDDVESALGILQQTADLLDLTAKKKLIMEGAPEFGAKIGDLMMLVASYTLA